MRTCNKIKDALHVPESPICLLCPQQWAHQSQDHFPKRRGTCCTSFDDLCELAWEEGKFKRTVPWDPMTNTCRFMSTTRTVLHHAFSVEIDHQEDMEEMEFVCMHGPHVIPPDDEDNDNGSEAESAS